MENFAFVAADLLGGGAAIRVENQAGMASALIRILEQPEERQRVAAAAKKCASRHRGAVDETVEVILRTAGAAPVAAVLRPATAWSGILLAPLATVYGFLVGKRNRGYDRNPGAIGKADIPVISVGNLAVGGTGKTPVTVALARLLHDDGWKPVIVSRGYGRRGRAAELRTVDSSPGKPLRDARRYGDEPALMARRLEGVPVVVCSDRLRAIRHARERFGVDLALLDDGFQHRRLHRDLDLLLIDSLNPFGNGRLLPAGPLREPLCEIRRASAVLLTRWNLSPGDDALAATVHRWTHPGTPLFRFRQRSLGVLGPIEGARKSLEELRKIPVLAFAGIGNPGSFAAELQRSGLQVQHTLWFRDHHPYSATDRDRILKIAARVGAEVLLTTEKDRMRFPVEGCPLPLYALEIALEPIEASEFHRFLRERLPRRSEPQRPTGA
jgi:tetraacyldisaccharide 4'-kinase